MHSFWAQKINLVVVKNLNFRKIVQAEVRERITASVKAYLDENFASEWDAVMDGEKLIGDLVAEFVPIVQARMTTDLTQRTLQEIQNQLRGY